MAGSGVAVITTGGAVMTIGGAVTTITTGDGVATGALSPPQAVNRPAARPLTARIRRRI